MSGHTTRGQTAFPSDIGDGLSIRDYFAAAALQGMLADDGEWEIPHAAELLAGYAYRFADAMLKAREETKDAG